MPISGEFVSFGLFGLPQQPTISPRISVSVCCMPSRAIFATPSMVCSIVSSTMPWPGWNAAWRIVMLCARIAASTLVAIFAAQDAFAPSQTMPATFARVLLIVVEMSSTLPP